MDFKQYFTQLKKEQPETEKLFRYLSSGKAHTLIELSDRIGMKRANLKVVLSHLKEKNMLKIRGNRQHTYYYLQDNNLKSVLQKGLKPQKNREKPKGMKFSRHCYKHLAGYAGVQIEQALVDHQYIIPQDLPEDQYGAYKITSKGWKWFNSLGIKKEEIDKKGSRLTKQCLDFSERKNHLGGKLGDALLSSMLEKKWVKQVPKSREIRFTDIGRTAIKSQLEVDLS